MEHVFSDHIFVMLLVYLDDLLVFSQNVEEHLGRIDLNLNQTIFLFGSHHVLKNCVIKAKLRYLLRSAPVSQRQFLHFS